MSNIIRISRKEHGFFLFLGEKGTTIVNYCGYCGNILDLNYVYIIKNLIKAGLLDKEFKRICCNCFYTIKHCGSVMCRHSNTTNPFIIEPRKTYKCNGIMTYRPYLVLENCVEFICNRCRKAHKIVNRNDL